MRKIVNPRTLKSVTGVSADFVSNEIELRYTDNVGIQLVWKNGVGFQGDWRIQATIDGVNWSNLEFSTPMPVDGESSGNYLVNLQAMPFDRVRIQFDHAGGTGDCDVWLMAKTEGA